LKTEADFDGRASSFQIVVDNHDGVTRPPKMEGPIHKRVLQPR
jgi:hypothetical protein